MAKCGYCGTTVLFGRRKDGDLRFCNDECHANGFLLSVANEIPEGVVTDFVNKVHTGPCPRCQGQEGPVDVHLAYKVWSALLVTSWSSKPLISCRSCGVKKQVGGALFSIVLGWWGFPWGFIMTPIQVIRNIVGMVSEPDASRPSPKMENILRLNLAAQLVEQSEAGQNQA